MIRRFGYMPVTLVASCFAFISYVTGNIVFSEYLQITYIEGTGEISIRGAPIGACLYFYGLTLRQLKYLETLYYH